MQHYGLPTRILDWTESALVGAWFASNDHADEPGAIWGVLPYELNKQQIKEHIVPLPTKPVIQPFFNAAFGLGHRVEQDVVAVCPIEIDPRMLVQSAAYTIHSKSTPLDKILEPASTPEILYKIVISSAAKGKLQKQLRSMGIRRSFLFPDLTNLATDLAFLPPDEL